MRLTHFGSYAFPEYDPDDPLDTAPAPRALAALPGGGAFDHIGTDTAPGQPRRLTKTFSVLESTALLQDTALDAARALNGKRDLLWALVDDNTMRWTWAACEGINYSRGRGGLAQVVAMSFMLPNPGWYGLYRGIWHLDGDEQLGAGPSLNQTPSPMPHWTQTVVLTNGGNQPVTAVKLRVTAGADAVHARLQAIHFEIAGRTDIWFGIPSVMMEANDVLLIDGGAKTCTLNGVDCYAELTLGVTQRPDWVTLQPGANNLVITLVTDVLDAQYPTVEALYCEKWE
jgi:mannose-6-phosphate isomerase-like protein (cupin superfamily)